MIVFGIIDNGNISSIHKCIVNISEKNHWCFDINYSSSLSWNDFFCTMLMEHILHEIDVDLWWCDVQVQVRVYLFIFIETGHFIEEKTTTTDRNENIYWARNLDVIVLGKNSWIMMKITQFLTIWILGVCNILYIYQIFCTFKHIE